MGRYFLLRTNKEACKITKVPLLSVCKTKKAILAFNHRHKMHVLHPKQSTMHNAIWQFLRISLSFGIYCLLICRKINFVKKKNRFFFYFKICQYFLYAWYSKYYKKKTTYYPVCSDKPVPIFSPFTHTSAQ